MNTEYVTQSGKVTPKDFFLYLGVLVSLYWSAGSLLSLLFRIIDRTFPDALNSGYYYYAGFDGAMRFAVASLIIIFPVYLILSRVIANSVRKDTTKLEIWVRKWFVYLTLFVAGGVVVGDLVALVNSFLGGEITIRFVLKMLSVFAVAGVVFWYYLYQMRTRGGTSKSGKIFMGLAVLGVIAAIVGGFMVMGTPSEQRNLRFDQERVRDLESIQWRITDYYQTKKALPISLDEMTGALGIDRLPADPETDEAYGYTRLSEMSFELCATFALTSPEESVQIRESYARTAGLIVADSEEGVWYHELGTECFERTIDPDYFKQR